MSDEKIRPGGVIENFQSLIHNNEDENTSILPNGSSPDSPNQSRFVKNDPDARRLTEVQPPKIQRTFRKE